MSDAPVTFWRDVRERGSLVGMLFTAMVYRVLGRWAAEPVLWGIAAYFFLTNGRMRQASRQYLRRVADSPHAAKDPGWMEVYRHYLSFARTSLDRLDVWVDRLNDYTFHFHGEEHLVRLLEQRRGALLLSAHMGNFDTLRALSKRRGGKVHILTDRGNSKKFSAILKRFCPGMEEGAVEYESGSLESLFELKRMVERGEFVGLLGDRVAALSGRGLQRVSPAVFLGAPALFPHAPFLFAGHLNCPVLLLFGLRRSSRVYDLYIELFSERIDLSTESREEVLKQQVSAFAARLDYYCRRFPLQWFNFYDFWGELS